MPEEVSQDFRFQIARKRHSKWKQRFSYLSCSGLLTPRMPVILQHALATPNKVFCVFCDLLADYDSFPLFNNINSKQTSNRCRIGYLVRVVRRRSRRFLSICSSSKCEGESKKPDCSKQKDDFGFHNLVSLVLTWF
jgi:hypothetical protein